MASKNQDKSENMRRIYAEDPNGSLSSLPSLSRLCLQWIVNNFEEKPIFEELSPIQRDFVKERLSTSLPLNVTVDLVPDGVYWKRCCKQRWDVCDVSHYGDSWKRMFLERHLECIIEEFIPDVTEPKAVLEMVPLCKNYIKKLNISQLLPAIKEQEKEKHVPDFTFEDDDPDMYHFDFSILLGQLTNLEELHLVYKVKQCGMDFEWSMFQMTKKDCASLAHTLKFCKTLKILTNPHHAMFLQLFNLRDSHVEDTRCQMLVKYLLDHPSLRELDFSHNIIKDSGAKAIAKLLTRSKLEILNLSNNRITNPGAQAIADALSSNSTLLVLNLRLNGVTDEGGQAIGKALLNNSTLSCLHLEGNKVTFGTACALSKALAKNKTLRRINLSRNKLGEVGGKALAEAMSQNSTVVELDVLLTDIEEETASTINKAVRANQSAERERQIQQGRRGRVPRLVSDRGFTGSFLFI